MTLDEAISHALEVAEQNDTQAEKWQKEGGEQWGKTTACRECAADHRQLAEWLIELKDLREENKVLTSECDRLIKEKGELLSKVSGGDVLRICQLEDRLQVELDNSHCLEIELAEAKRLLKATIEDLSITVAEVYNGGLVCECCKWKSQIDGCCCPNDGGCDVAYRWRYADETEKLLNDEKINNVE